ncbi:MAG: Type I restriction-modification system, DNA-methyltransferase subunit M [Ktedonobacterales bacterium]|jgi:type I restriction enzyme M protein|nr:MAG: Type I restriction-modification system, DNA-methyltransferase subunit M [Ktedonobacterales bacterium]
MPANNHAALESKLWDSADQLRTNSGLRASEYSVPVLGLIFLRFADHKFTHAQAELAASLPPNSRRTIDKADYQARGVMYVPEAARYSTLLRLPEGDDIAKAVTAAMHAIEAENPDLKDTLPKSYNRLEKDTLWALLKIFSAIPMDLEGDVFGKIYEYFLSEFAKLEGQRGGEFFTPTPIVKLIVEVIEPFHGRILDPACGSGGMFVQSARFVRNHQQNPTNTISLYGQEKTRETIRLCKMNLAVHGLSGDIKEANTYYQNVHNCVGRFEFVMANPPFNADGVDKEKIKGDHARYPFGMPRVDNANYLWIQEFYSALNPQGRAGFVMANSASDARASEQVIRQKLIEDGVVDVMVSVGPNFFYTVTLPCTLWFFDKAKRSTPRGDTVLFLDARHIFHQLDRAHREFTPQQIEYLANIVRLYRGEPVENAHDSAALLAAQFPDGVYRDVPGLCRVATRAQIAAQGWSLNPGRYVGVAERAPDDFDFRERLEELHEELERLNAEAHTLEDRISANVAALLEAE